MKCVRTFGVAGIAVVSLLAICRPASATDLMFSFTAANLESAMNSSPSFGSGECTSGASLDTFSELCGVYQVIATPNLVTANMSSALIQTSPLPGAGAWETEITQADTVYNSDLPYPNLDTAIFYADYADTSDTLVSFVTNNSSIVGQDFSSLNGCSPVDSCPLLATTPLASNTLFSMRLTTTDQIGRAHV